MTVTLIWPDGYAVEYGAYAALREGEYALVEDTELDADRLGTWPVVAVTHVVTARGIVHRRVQLGERES
jgi:hypothetical protein